MSFQKTDTVARHTNICRLPRRITPPSLLVPNLTELFVPQEHQQAPTMAYFSNIAIHDVLSEPAPCRGRQAALMLLW